MLGKSLKKREQMEARFFKRMKSLKYNSDIWYFDEIIPSLVEKVEKSGRYNTELLQTIRMLKTYKSHNKALAADS